MRACAWIVGAVCIAGCAEAPVQPTPAPVQTRNVGDGYLVANTKPAARVLVDGEDTGRTTPIGPRDPLRLRSGKHIVTFVAEGKRRDVEMNIVSGQRFTVIQDLSE
jgi:hypothetical protein